MRVGLIGVILAIARLATAVASAATLPPETEARINALVGGFAGKVTLHAQNLDTGATFSIGDRKSTRLNSSHT